jgi:hypothetical protein
MADTRDEPSAAGGLMGVWHPVCLPEGYHAVPPGPLHGKAADATGYPLTHSHVLRQDTTPRTSGDLVSCPSRVRSPGDSRGTTDTNGQNLTDSAPEYFPAHRPLRAAPLHGGG